MGEIYATHTELKSFSDRLTNLENKVDKLSDDFSEYKISGRDEYHNLKSLIKEAVSDGNKEMQESLKEYTKQSSKQILELENRVHSLEDAESKKAEEEKKIYLAEKKDKRKWLFRTILACITTGTIMFFLTILLNNFISLITH